MHVRQFFQVFIVVSQLNHLECWPSPSRFQRCQKVVVPSGRQLKLINYWLCRECFHNQTKSIVHSRSRVSTVETHHCYPHIWLLVLHRHVITFNCCHSSHDRKSSWHCLSVWGENKSECHRDGITKCTPKDRVEGAEQPWECRIGKHVEASIELGLS